MAALVVSILSSVSVFISINCYGALYFTTMTFNCENASYVWAVFRRDCVEVCTILGRSSAPKKSTVCRLITKFQATCLVADIKTHGRARAAQTSWCQGNISLVQESVEGRCDSNKIHTPPLTRFSHQKRGFSSRSHVYDAF